MQSDDLAQLVPSADLELLRAHRFDPARFRSFQQAVASGSLHPASSLYRGRIDAPAPGDVEALPARDSEAGRALLRRGEAALTRGSVAAVVLAGGMATRFQGVPGIVLAPGEQVVKGTVEVLEGRSFIQLKLDDVRAVGRRYGKPVPFCVMGSFATLPGRNGLRRHLEDSGEMGDDVLLFSQSISVRLTPQGGVFGASDGGALPPESYTTPGHGDFFVALRDSGMLDALRARGIETLLFSNVDNLGATVDPLLHGHFLRLREERGIAMLAETVQRVPEDGAKVGVVVRADGLLRILEGFRIPDTVDQSALVDASINTFTFALAALDRDIPLDLHAVEKKVSGRGAIQGETVTCEATGSVDADGRPVLPFAAVRVPREGSLGNFFEGRFYPVKKPEDLDRVRLLLRVERLAVAARDLKPGATGEARYFWVPGRINVIGEHTDYNDGLVLPAAVDKGIVALARPRGDGERVLQSLQAPDGDWSRYAEAVVQALGERGVQPTGFDLVLTSDLPSGSGMSSSAAVCLAVACAATMDAPLSPADLARVAQRAEHLVGVQVGIMDQWAIAHGVKGHALRLDCRSLTTTPVPLALGDFALVVADTGKRRELSSSAYNTRREECAEAARRLGRQTLREVLVEELGGLPEPLRSRATHVVEENARVDRAVAALQNGDLVALGKLFDASHASLRDRFEVSSPELDALVDAICTAGGSDTLGARMMGGGFGGCTLSLVRRDALARVFREAGSIYEKKSGIRATFWTVEIGRGLHQILA
ncbi:MAG: galactokinase [Deltaproteobacteria bacterium]|nr:galactokinase [Deltaproteobacteria bacterium]